MPLCAPLDKQRVYWQVSLRITVKRYNSKMIIMLSVQIEMDTQNVLLCWTYKNITQFIAVRSSLNGTYNLPVKRRLTISISLAQSTNYACGIYINTHIRYMQVCISVSSNMLLTCSSGIAVAECQAQEDIRPTDVTTTHYN